MNICLYKWKFNIQNSVQHSVCRNFQMLVRRELPEWATWEADEAWYLNFTARQNLKVRHNKWQHIIVSYRSYWSWFHMLFHMVSYRFRNCFYMFWSFERGSVGFGCWRPSWFSPRERTNYSGSYFSMCRTNCRARASCQGAVQGAAAVLSGVYASVIWIHTIPPWNKLKQLEASWSTRTHTWTETASKNPSQSQTSRAVPSEEWVEYGAASSKQWAALKRATPQPELQSWRRPKKRGSIAEIRNHMTYLFRL